MRCPGTDHPASPERPPPGPGLHRETTAPGKAPAAPAPGGVLASLWRDWQGTGDASEHPKVIELRGWKRVACGTAMLALAGGMLLAVSGMVVAGVRADTVGGLVAFAVVFNLLLASLFAAIALLDSRRPTGNGSAADGAPRAPGLTPAGWVLLALVANVLAGLVLARAAPEPPVWLSPRISALVIGLPTFLVGWGILRLLGVPVMRRDGAATPPGRPKQRPW